MFGTQQQNGQPAKRGLFDLNPPTTQASSQQPLFSNVGQTSGTQTGQTGLNLNLNLGGAQQQPQQQASIFSQNPPTFGGLGTSTQPQTQTQSQSQSNPFGGLSILGQGQQQQQQPQAQQQQGGLGLGQTTTTGPVAPSSQSAFFSTLLERAKKRPQGKAAKGPAGDVPSLELGLGDIRRAARGLGGGREADGLKQPIPDTRGQVSTFVSKVKRY